MITMTTNDARHELEFIKAVDHNAPGSCFNHDRDCFARYCDMQANKARRHGFHAIARRILAASPVTVARFPITL